MLNIILVSCVVIWGIYKLVNLLRYRKVAHALDNEAFKQDIRKAQLIDVREKDTFKRKHILGARNIPYSQLKQRQVELRHDQPIYLYDNGNRQSLKAALVLKKAGYTDLYYLKNGFEQWNGRTK